MTVVKVPTDQELHSYLELPEEQRAGKADEFLDKVGRRILDLGKRLDGNARWFLAQCGLEADHHAEEVVGKVILKALQNLKCQMLGKPVSLVWRRDMPLYAYLRVIHGIPFDGKRSGVITNYVRKHAKVVPISLSDLSGTDMETDRRLVDAETIAILKQELRTGDDARNERQRRREEALNQLAKSKPRDVLVYRLRTGTHRFQKLDSESIAALAINLPRAKRRIISTIAKLRKINAGPSLDPKTVSELFGLGTSRIRQIVREVATTVEAALNSAPTKPGKVA